MAGPGRSGPSADPGREVQEVVALQGFPRLL
jgi:hypothetical protein